MNSSAFLLCRLPNEQDFQLYADSPTGKEEVTFVDFKGVSFSFLASQTKSNLENISALALPTFSRNSTTKSEHIRLLDKAILNLQKHPNRKVVLARNRFYNHVLDFRESLERLAHYFPSAFVYLLYHPNCGAWLGATPELLGKFTSPDFYTMALAGTKTPKDVWTKKEQHEHQFVINHILNRLPKATQEKTRTLSYGQIQHLYTPIKVSGINYLDAQSMLTKLHPTSAICGSPTEWAKSYILANEQFNRGLYSGYIGIKNKNKQSLISFVNLRCVQLFSNGFLAYAGGGITHQSQSVLEWQETENKLDSFVSQVY